MKVRQLQLLSLAAIFGCPAPSGTAETSDGATVTTGTSTTGPSTTSTSGEPPTSSATGTSSSSSTAAATTDPGPTSTTTDPVDSTSTTTDPVDSTSTGDSSTSTTGVETTTGAPAPDFKPLALEVADFNGDGAADLLVLGVDEENIVAGGLSLGLGDGTFAPAIDPKLTGTSAFPTIGHLDGKKGVDVMMANGGIEAQIFRWSVSAFIPWKSIASAGTPLVHVVADTDNSGHDDVVVLWREGNKFGTVLHWGSNNFVPWPRKITTLGTTDQFLIAPTGILVGHLDGDTFADALIFESDAPGGFLRVLGALDGSFNTPTPIAPALRPWTAALGDFNEDKILDVLAAEHTPSRLALLIGSGDGGFAPATTVDILGFVPLALTLADLDGDGHLDVIAVDDQTPELRVWPGLGDGTFATAQTLVLPSGAIRAHAALLDADPKLDLAVATFEAGAVTILLTP